MKRMGKILEQVAEWLGGNWGWIALAGVFVDISPIKFNPISGILRWIGTKMTGDIRNDLADLRQDFDGQQMNSIRSDVLRFADSCLKGEKHTKEEFDHIINLNKQYEELVKKYRIKNDVYKESYEYIMRIYRRRLDKRDFLHVPPAGVNEGDEIYGAAS